MSLSLVLDLEAEISRKVESGEYSSSSEVVREALRLLDERDALRQSRLEALRAAVQVGIDELDRGEAIDGERAFAYLLRGVPLDAPEPQK